MEKVQCVPSTLLCRVTNYIPLLFNSTVPGDQNRAKWKEKQLLQRPRNQVNGQDLLNRGSKLDNFRNEKEKNALTKLLSYLLTYLLRK